jgi:hypothetical protein
MPKEFKLSIYKIIIGTATTLLTGAVIGAIAILRAADSNTIRIIAVEGDLSEIKRDYVSKSEFKEFTSKSLDNDRNLDQKITDILHALIR